MRLLFLALALLSSTSLAAEPRYLCKADEQLVFGCHVGKKLVSICASSPVSPTSGHVQYRYGTPKKIELAYPPSLKPPKGRFFLSNVGYSGGGEGRIRFENDGYEYFVFDSTVRTNFKEGEPHFPRFDAGVIVRRQGKTLSILRCKEDESIRAVAYDQFEREEFDRNLVP